MTYTILRIIDILLFTCFGFVGMRFIEQISDNNKIKNAENTNFAPIQIPKTMTL